MSATTSSSSSSDPRRQRSRRSEKAAAFSRRVIGLALLLLLLSGGALAWNSRGRAFYQRRQREQEVQQAEAALAAKRFEEAATLARQVGAVDTRNLRAARIAAEALQAMGLEDCVRWWRRVAELSRYEAEAVTAWAGAAFQFDDLRSAYAALRQFPRGTDTAAYHDLAGRAALGREDLPKARFHFAKALAKAPDDPAIRSRFAEAHLDSPQPEERSRAVAFLESLAQQPENSRALSLLTREALERRDTGRAAQLSERLLARINLTFADRLVHLSVLHRGEAPTFSAERDRLQSEAVRRPELLVQWLEWSAQEGFAAAALKWFKGLDPEIQNRARVMSAAADLHVILEDWKGLREWVFNANWAELEPQRMAFEGLAAVRLSLGGVVTAADGPWRQALREAKGQAQHLHWLATRAERWGLFQPAEATLWQMVQKDIDPDGTLERLASLYRRQNQADGLLRVAKRQLELHPRDPAAEADALYFGSLLQIDTLQLRPLAERVAARVVEAPESAVAVAMYRARTGEAGAGLKLLRSLPPAELEATGRRALLVLLLALDDDRAAAREELERGVTGAMLPPEALLVDEARALIRSGRNAR